MVRINRLAIIIATIAGVAAAPAQAKSGEMSLYAGSADLTRIVAKPCVIAPASHACVTQQNEAIRTATQKATAGQRKVSVEEVGRQQLDALIASLD